MRLTFPGSTAVGGGIRLAPLEAETLPPELRRFAACAETKEKIVCSEQKVMLIEASILVMPERGRLARPQQATAMLPTVD